MIIRYHGQRPSACADTSATEQRIAGIDPEFNRRLGEYICDRKMHYLDISKYTCPAAERGEYSRECACDACVYFAWGGGR